MNPVGNGGPGKNRLFPWAILLIFLFLATGIAVAGYLYNRSQRARIEVDVRTQLETIADLKVRQIENWLQERYGDARVIRGNGWVQEKLAAFLSFPTKKLGRELREWMNSLRRNYGYQNVLLDDSAGNIRIAAESPEDTSAGAEGLRLIGEVSRSRDVILTELYRPDKTQRIFLDLVISVLSAGGSGSTSSVAPSVVGALFLRIDPDRFLYPLIQTWPTSSRSAETLLVKREGTEIVFLNELRHRQDTALNLRLPAGTSDLPAALATRGKEGAVEGRDYRGIPVLAALRFLPNTSWFLVAKIDRNEVFAPLFHQSWLTVMVMFLLVAISGTGLGMVWRHQRAFYYRNLLKEETKRLTLTRHFENLVRYANDIIVLFDERMRIVEVNDRALHSYGYDQEELIGLPVTELRPPELRAGLVEKMKEVEGRDGIIYETVHVRKDGSSFPVEISLRSISVRGQKNYQGIIRDITERKRAEETLRESDKQYRAFFKTSRDCVFITTEDGRWIDMNDAAVELFGYSTRDELMQEKIPNLYVNAEDRIKHIRTILKQGYTKDYPVDLRKKGGEVVHTLVTSVVRYDADGSVRGLMGTIKDITERKRAEEEAKSARAFLEMVIDMSPFAMWISDREGTVTRANRSLCDTVNLAEGNIVGKYNVLKDENLENQGVMPKVRAVFEKLEPARFNIPWMGANAGSADLKEARNMHIDVSMFPIFTPQGELTNVVCQWVDITDQKRAEEEILALNAELEQRVLQRTAELKASNKELEAFSYSVSHDLRAPLRAIDGFSRIILEDYGARFDEEGQRLLGVIRGNTRKMSQLIDDLLAFSRLSRQQMALGEIDMAVLADSVFADLKDQEKGREIEFRIGAVPVAWGDRNLLRQVLINLLANAVKFTRRRAKARIELGGREENGNTVYHVRDNGVGFDMKYVDKLFGVFQRLHGSDEFEGTGVGLAIVQRVVLRHGGRVWAEGTEGQGATFYFSLPGRKS